MQLGAKGKGEKKKKCKSQHAAASWLSPEIPVLANDFNLLISLTPVGKGLIRESVLWLASLSQPVTPPNSLTELHFYCIFQSSPFRLPGAI